MMKDFVFCPFCGARLNRKKIENADRMFCQDCDYIQYKNPLPSAAGVIFRGNEVLLIKRGVEPGRGKWSLPSGFIEDGETPVEGCIREMEEETGLMTEVLSMLDVCHVFSEVYGGVVIIVYLLEEIGGEVRAGSDVDDAAYFPVERLPEIHLDCLRDIIFKAYGEGAGGGGGGDEP